MDMEAAAASSDGVETLDFEFRGNAREYFGIWIVNLLLSIVTIGIYTAWAKVRRLRYFYGNTYLDSHNFEYHAKPKQILIGRLIVVSLLLVLFILQTINPIFSLLIIPYLIALPWLINKSMAFNARMTSYRNVRLNFKGSYWAAFGIFVLMPLFAILTLGLLAPIASRLSSNYIGNNLKFGTSQFTTKAPTGSLYANFGITVLLAIIAALLFGVFGYIIAFLVSALGISPSASSADEAEQLSQLMPGFGSMLGIYAAFFLSFYFYRAGVRNIAFCATELEGGHRLSSNLDRLFYVWILLSNFFAVVFTIGLLRPWAAIRTWRYLSYRTNLITASSLDGFVDQAAPEGSVAAAEYFDIEGIDFGL